MAAGKKGEELVTFLPRAEDLKDFAFADGENGRGISSSKNLRFGGWKGGAFALFEFLFFVRLAILRGLSMLVGRDDSSDIPECGRRKSKRNTGSRYLSRSRSRDKSDSRRRRGKQRAGRSGRRRSSLRSEGARSNRRRRRRSSSNSQRR